MDVGSWEKWQSTQLSAIDQEVVRISWLAGNDFKAINSRLLVRRQWETVDGFVNDPAIVLYPSIEPQVLYLPVSQEFIEAGLSTFKIQIKKLIRFKRFITTDLLYSIKVEVM